MWPSRGNATTISTSLKNGLGYSEAMARLSGTVDGPLSMMAITGIRCSSVVVPWRNQLCMVGSRGSAVCINVEPLFRYRTWSQFDEHGIRTYPRRSPNLPGNRVGIGTVGKGIARAYRDYLCLRSPCSSSVPLKFTARASVGMETVTLESACAMERNDSKCQIPD